MAEYKKYINALRKCAKEHENDITPTFQIIVSDLCKDTAKLLENDVVERAEYDKLKSQLDYEHEHGIEAANNLLDVLGKLDFQRQENKKLRTKIDKAIAEIQEFEMSHCINVMDWEDIIPECLEIIKRNIGE